MFSSRRPLWRYPLFQIPALFCVLFLILALLFWLLGLGRPSVAVAISLDLSTSTYQPQAFNAPGTVMAEEIQSVMAYLDQNSPELLRQPNQIQVFGFADQVRPLTTSFQANSEQVKNELAEALQDPTLATSVGGRTDLSLAIQEGVRSLGTVTDRCRELLLVTDGEANVSPVAVSEALLSQVKINAIVVGAEAPALLTATQATGGAYSSANISNLPALFTDSFFPHFNSNLRWIIFWLGCAWIALMWLLVMLLDRWVFQDWLHIPMDLAGKAALGNAYFWTLATPGIIWRLAGGIPFISQC